MGTKPNQGSSWLTPGARVEDALGLERPQAPGRAPAARLQRLEGRTGGWPWAWAAAVHRAPRASLPGSARQRPAEGRRGGAADAVRGESPERPAGVESPGGRWRPRPHRRGQGALTPPPRGPARRSAAPLAIQVGRVPAPEPGWGESGEKGRASARRESPPPAAAATFPFSSPTWLERCGGEPAAPCCRSLLRPSAATAAAPQPHGAQRGPGPGRRPPPACGAPRTRAPYGWLSGEHGLRAAGGGCGMAPAPAVGVESPEGRPSCGN